MYEAHFNLKHKPFSLLPDPEFLFLSDKHAIALSLLEYCLSGQAGFCIITGDIGSGKTTLVRAFLGRIGRDFSVGLISNTHAALTDISAWALNAFDQRPASSNPAQTYQELMAFLIAEYGAGRQCILIVDEAQNLSVQALEELRLLSNINTGKDLLLQMVLVGQPELLEKLRRPELSQFAQRIAVSHHLTPLPFADSRRYIQHRLKVAGCDQPIFTEMAMGAVQYFSGGVPRLINSICDMALVYAFADGATTIGEDLVFRVVADRQKSGIAPFASTISADDPTVRAAISDLAGANASQRASQPAAKPAAPLTEQSAAPQEAGAETATPPLAAAQKERGEEVPAIEAARPPEATKTELVKSQVVQPEVVKPEVVQPEMAKPEMAKPELVKPDSGKIDFAMVNVARTPIESKPTSDLYFAGPDEDELLLTLQAEPLATARPASAPRVASQLAATNEPVLERTPTLVSTDDKYAGDPANVMLARTNEGLRPNWQHPAATIDSRPWPSISRVDGAHGANSPVEMAKAVTISPQSAGTAAPSRRSWWRRSFSRGK